MAITARTKVADLLEDHPEVDEVFENYGVEVTDELMVMTLKEVCRTESINYWELKSDIVEAVGWDGTADGDLFDEEEDEDEDDMGWSEDEEEEDGEDDLDLPDDDYPDDDDDDEDEDDGSTPEEDEDDY